MNNKHLQVSLLTEINLLSSKNLFYINNCENAILMKILKSKLNWVFMYLFVSHFPNLLYVPTYLKDNIWKTE